MLANMASSAWETCSALLLRDTSIIGSGSQWIYGLIRAALAEGCNFPGVAEGMARTEYNAKSDVPAKQAFVEHLLRERHFDEARVTKSPADVTAIKDRRTYYFEIKYTAQLATYFGAATLTEWKAALENESRFWFVIATLNDGQWRFREYTPTEFMTFSYIPPFKVFFSVPVGDDLPLRTWPPRGRSGSTGGRVLMTRERMSAMLELYGRFRTYAD